MSFDKTAISFSYGYEIRHIIYRRTSIDRHPLLPSFAGFGEIKISKFRLQDCVFEVRSFGTLFDRTLKNSTDHIFRPFELKFSVVGSCVLLCVKKILEK